MNAPGPHCAFTDAIVASHLDGGVEVDLPGGWLPASALVDHLGACGTCQRALQQSRRLDAVLAASAGRQGRDVEADPDHLSRLVERALRQAADCAPAAPREPRALHPWRQVVASVLLVGTGFAAAVAFAPHRQRDAAPPPAAATAAARAAPAPAGPFLPAGAPAGEPAARPSAAGTAFPLGIPLPAARPRGVPAAEVLPPAGAGGQPADVQHLAGQLADRSLADRLLLVAGLRLACLGLADLRAPLAAAALDPGAAAISARDLRRRCSQLLLEATGQRPLDAWVAAVARLEGGPLLDAVLEDARRHPGLAPRLRARLLAGLHESAPATADLDRLAALATAARVGGRDLDAAVRQLLRRVELHQELAAALRADCRRPGRAALLLDVFADLVARGAADDERLAHALFTRQPPSIVAELCAELRDGRHGARRCRALLALGALGHPGARPVLLDALHGAALPEAHAAAFALGMLPRTELRDLLPEAERGADAWLLRAALCRAGEPRALQWIETLDLSPAERELLGAGGFTFAQFPVFAAILRDRGTATF